MEKPVPIYETERGEVEYYKKVNINTKVTVPITREGFEALLDRACAFYRLPKDDGARQIACGWVHHLDRGDNETTIKALAKALHKQLANSLTMAIYDEINQRLKAEKEAAAIHDAPSVDLNGKADTLIPETNETAH